VIARRPPRAAIVLPVKDYARAKHRLSAVFAGDQRRALMKAMLADVLAALDRVRAPHTLLLVTAEPQAIEAAARIGAEVVAEASEPGHSRAAARGVAVCVARGVERVLLIPGDCPLLDPASVDGLLARPPARGGSVGLVTDRAGEGTNALLLEPPDAIVPAFGPGSHERHRTAARTNGIPFEVLDIPSLRLDVDTPSDVAALRSALVDRPDAAPHTSETLRELAAARGVVR
jgi:2-phospho-L-lactate guanylyltransferase